MNRDRKRTLIRAAIALDLVVIATAVVLLFPPSPLLLLAVFFAAVALASSMAGWRLGAGVAIASLLPLAWFADVIRSDQLALFVIASAAAVALSARRDSAMPAREPVDPRDVRPLLPSAFAHELDQLEAEANEQFQRELDATRAELAEQVRARVAAERARMEQEAEEAVRQVLEEEQGDVQRRVDEVVSTRRALVHVRPATPPPTGADDEEDHAPEIPRWLQYGLPLVVVLVYYNLPDIISSNTPLPSVLQPLIVILGLAVFLYRRAFRPAQILSQPLTLLLAGYLAIIFASSAWAGDLRAADKRITDTLKHLLVFVLVGSLAFSWKTLRRALVTMAVASAIIATIAMVQIATGNTFGELWGLAAVQIGNIYGDQSDLRASGPVNDPNYFGQILMIVVPIAFFLGRSAPRPRTRLWWLGVAAIIVGGILATYSRGAMLALVVVAALTVAALRVRPSRIAFVAVMMLLLLVVTPGNISRRFMTLGSIAAEQSEADRDGSIERRKLYYGTAMRMFEDHPLLGVGVGNYTTRFLQYANEVGFAGPLYSDVAGTQHAHMLYLELGAETGILGLATFLAAMSAAIYMSWRCARELRRRGDHAHAALAAALGIAVCGHLVTSLFLHTGYQRYLWLLLAFIAATTRLTFRKEEPA